MWARQLYKIKKTVVFVLLLLFVLVSLFPVYWTVNTSLKLEKEVFSQPFNIFPKNPKFHSYRHVITRTLMVRYIINSILVVSITVLLILMTSSLAAYSFSRYRIPGKRVLLLILLGAMMLPRQLNIVPYYLIMQKFHLLDTYYALILVYTVVGIPYSTWLLVVVFDGIPPVLDEAAFIDGCSRISFFYRILVPLSKSGFVAVAIYNAIRTWKDLIIALTLTSSASMKTVPVGVYGFLGAERWEWSYVSAAAVIALFPILAAFLALRRQFVRGLSAGAIKE